MVYAMDVAPHAGAWIETISGLTVILLTKSLPTRERGLKHTINDQRVGVFVVAPHAGAWIETKMQLL